MAYLFLVRPIRVICLLPVVFVAATALARERQYLSGTGFFIHVPGPQYPLQARRTHQAGDWRFRPYIDK